MDLKNYDGAIEDYSRAIEIDRSQPLSYINRADLLLKLNDLNGAIADFSRAISLQPKNADLYYLRANAMMELDNFKDAITDFTKVLSMKVELIESRSLHMLFVIFSKGRSLSSSP